MDVLLVVAPVFALIVLGYVAAWVRLLSEGAHKGLSDFAFGIAVPALMLRVIATAQFPEVNPLRVWAAYYGAIAFTWLLATCLARFALRRTGPDSVTISVTSVYGNIVMLGIPLSLAAFGPEAAGPMALILAINTPLLWLAGTLQMSVVDLRRDTGLAGRVASLGADLIRNPIILGILGGAALRLADVGIHPVADKTLALVAQAGVPTSLIALGAGLRKFRIEGQMPLLGTMCLLKLLVLPLAAGWLALEVLHLPKVAAGVVIIFAAMPAGANAFLFASRYGRVIDSTSGAIALGTLISALTVSAVIGAML
jgi:malonate transporter